NAPRCRQHLWRRIEADRAVELGCDRRQRVAGSGADIEQRAGCRHQRCQSLEIRTARMNPTLRVRLRDFAELLARRSHGDIVPDDPICAVACGLTAANKRSKLAASSCRSICPKPRNALSSTSM